MRLALILIGFLLTQPVWAGWSRLWSMNDGGKDEFTVYVDYESIRKAGDNRRIWVVLDHKFPQGILKYKSTRMLLEVDCTGERMRVLSETQWSGAFGEGRVVYSTNDPEGWAYIPPGRGGADLLKIACNYRIPK